MLLQYFINLFYLIKPFYKKVIPYENKQSTIKVASIPSIKFGYEHANIAYWTINRS
jgi:hypothetical protein